MLVDERGTNEMSSGKATAFFRLFGQINSVLFALLHEVLAEAGRLDATAGRYLAELERYSLLRKRDLLSPGAEIVETFEIDLERVETARFQIEAGDARLPEARRYALVHNDRQQELIAQYADEFGGTFDGLGKMLMRYPHVHRLFRQSRAVA